jgi:hypothetical protein
VFNNLGGRLNSYLLVEPIFLPTFSPSPVAIGVGVLPILDDCIGPQSVQGLPQTLFGPEWVIFINGSSYARQQYFDRNGGLASISRFSALPDFPG